MVPLLSPPWLLPSPALLHFSMLYFIAIVLAPGAPVVERMVAEHIGSLLLIGGWQDISARGQCDMRATRNTTDRTLTRETYQRNTDSGFTITIKMHQRNTDTLMQTRKRNSSAPAQRRPWCNLHPLSWPEAVVQPPSTLWCIPGQRPCAQCLAQGICLQ